MSDHYGVYFRFKLKSDTPKSIIDGLKNLFSDDEAFTPSIVYAHTPENEEFKNLFRPMFKREFCEPDTRGEFEDSFWFSVWSNSAYHEGWFKHGFTDDHVFWSYGSPVGKCFDSVALVTFFVHLFPWLDVVDDEIVAYIVYEYSERDSVIYIDKECGTVNEITDGNRICDSLFGYHPNEIYEEEEEVEVVDLGPKTLADLHDFTLSTATTEIYHQSTLKE